MIKTKVRKAGRQVHADPEQLSLQIRSFKRNYFIVRSGTGETAFADDEAALEIEGTIEQVCRRFAKHLKQPISVRLLNSKRYTIDRIRDCHFFGSLSLRGQQRDVVAYLPGEVFWELPASIEPGASVIEVTFEPMGGGHGDLESLYIGNPEALAAAGAGA